MSEAEGVIFNRAVNFVLPHAIPTHFDRSEEYKLGDVLVYEKKLRALMPWRRHRLVFTGVNISDLLTEAIQIDKKEEDTFTEANTTRTFGESAKVDAEVAYAVAHFGAKIAESERATVSVNFGKVSRHYSNLSELLSRQAAEKKYQVLSHPVIRDAIAHNRTLFVINNLYVAEKADVSLIVTGDDAGPNPPPPSSSSASGGTTSTTSSTTNTTTTNTTTTTTDPPPPTTEAPSSGSGGLTIGGDIDVSFGKTGKSGILTIVNLICVYKFYGRYIICAYNITLGRR